MRTEKNKASERNKVRRKELEKDEEEQEEATVMEATSTLWWSIFEEIKAK